MSTKPPNGTSLRESASFELSSVKIRRCVWPVGELKKGINKKNRYISPICPEATYRRICTKFGAAVGAADVITCTKFFGDWSRGVYSVGGGENCHLPLTKPVAVNTGLALPRSPWSRYLTFCWAIALADTEKRHVWNSKRTSSLFPPETAHDSLHNGILTHQGACLFAQRVAYIVSRTTRRVRCHYHPAERHYINK